MHTILHLRAMLVRGLILIPFASLVAATNAPRGWFPAGSKPAEYEMTSDSSVFRGGKYSATLKCIVENPAGFGTLMQEIKATAYLGTRLRFSGFVRAQDVTGWAGLWMRVDGKDRLVLAFDNMYPRAIKGTSEWTNYEIVLDVPEASEMIAFGLLLNGAGQVWMDDMKFEVVGKEISTTDGRQELGLPRVPKLDIP